MHYDGIKQIKDLEAHSAMLGQIAGCVAEYCIDDEMTTEEAVRWVVASYKKLLAEKELDQINRIIANRHTD